MSTPDLAEAMRIYAERVVKTVQDEYGLFLDFSEQSIATVERILDTMYEKQLDFVEGKLHPMYPGLSRAEIALLIRDEALTEDTQRTAAYFGAYIGEVIRRLWGGTWTAESQFSRDPVYTLILPDTSEIYPLNKVCKRLVNGPEDNVDFYYMTIKQDITKSRGS